MKVPQDDDPSEEIGSSIQNQFHSSKCMINMKELYPPMTLTTFILAACAEGGHYDELVPYYG